MKKEGARWEVRLPFLFFDVHGARFAGGTCGALCWPQALLFLLGAFCYPFYVF